jgi:hypothetical protein
MAAVGRDDELGFGLSKPHKVRVSLPTKKVGRRIWEEVSLRLQTRGLPTMEPELVVDGPRFGQPQAVPPRHRQGAFRVIVTDVYKRQCVLTNSHVLHVLDVIHIRPYAEGGSHNPSKGLLLRQDVHMPPSIRVHPQRNEWARRR